MKIAILSDIHDHRERLSAALGRIQDTDCLICCGDLCSPFIMRDLGNGFTKPIHLVFGNNDGDLFRLTRAADEFPHIDLHGEVAALILDQKRFAISHFDTVGRMLATSNAFDVVCYGHNHEFEIAMDGDTLKINPGEIMGELTGESSLVIYDTTTGEAEKMTINAAKRQR